jgi:hypothetical protein
MMFQSPFTSNFSSFTPSAAYDAGSVFSGLGAAAGAAGAAAPAAGAAGASGLLAGFGGPLGLGLTAGASILGGIGAANAAEASLQAAKESQKLGQIWSLASQRNFQQGNIADQMRAAMARREGQRSGLGRPEAFQNLLSSGMSPSAANRAVFSPLFTA